MVMDRYWFIPWDKMDPNNVDNGGSQCGVRGTLPSGLSLQLFYKFNTILK